MNRLLCTRIIDTTLLTLVPSIRVMDRLIARWTAVWRESLVAEVLVLISAVLILAAADGEEPEEAGADGEGAREPSDAEEGRV